MEKLDPLERQEVKINETRDYQELFPWMLAPALVLLAAALALRGSRLGTLP
jgi:lipopolysaccharide export LptBFGC system permease protein LptF